MRRYKVVNPIDYDNGSLLYESPTSTADMEKEQNMLSAVSQNVDSIRKYLERHQLDAFILPTSDPHLGEYQTEDAQRVTWLTGFHGENCIAAITREKAAIFVDGRFTVQVKQQVPEDIFEYRHIVQECHLEWVQQHLPRAGRIGVDTALFNINWYRRAKTFFATKGYELVSLPENPVDSLWQDRPQPSSAPIELFTRAGRSCQEKREALAAALRERKLNAMLLTQPEDTNWLVNIRGSDIPFVRTAQSFAFQHASGELDLFIDTSRLPEGFEEWVGSDVEIHDISIMAAILDELAAGQPKILVDTSQTNAWVHNLLTEGGAILIEGKNICALMRTCKNDTELEGMKGAHIQDGIAMCRFQAWLDREVESSNQHTEATLAEQLLAFRESVEGFVAPSFSTISALGPNAAICHYHYDQNASRATGQDGLYLVDSGGHYNNGATNCGTTDITRTLKVGDITEEHRHLYTLVLKGHINLSTARFLPGTTGEQLDILARQPLWQEGFNYDHGTGHGIGHFLSVHEFPPSIKPGVQHGPLEPGMCLSNEPGYYREDGFGIRLENIVVVRNAPISGEIGMLEFETITFAPFDLRLIDTALLNRNEKEWLNSYHTDVFEKIAPALNEQDRLWLKNATRHID